MFPLSAYGLDESLHPACAVFLHLFGEVTIHIQSESGSCVTQILLYGLSIVTGFERSCGEGVAKIMKTGGTETQICRCQVEAMEVRAQEGWRYVVKGEAGTVYASVASSLFVLND